MQAPPKSAPEMIANEAIKDIPLNDPTSRIIRWNDAYLKAKEQDDAPQIPLGRRGRFLLMQRNALKNFRAGRNRFRDPGSLG